MFCIQYLLAAVAALVYLSGTSPVAGCPNIISRAEWGARDPADSTYMAPPVDHFVVHHSAGSTCDSVESCSTIVRAIQNYHMDSNGWWDIGYSFLIGGDGNVYEGRGWDVVGAHAGVTEYNSNGIGVCMLGDFTDSMPTQAALNALESFVDCCVSRSKLASDYNVVGHRDVRNTQCPGDRFYYEYVTEMTNYGV
ncbi:Peptidoglycan-recognition protein SC2 [Holothuria leucospilota]|uniref:Peptidoglycan-recognition protein n=1 Tax=Holothuria leucospilota TaxID=206669 RepID=A0A9Q1BC65_HOLLE|nr:Peptidoglycan-recognition protein SC2 [Holothuria leucospilota]